MTRREFEDRIKAAKYEFLHDMTEIVDRIINAEKLAEADFENLSSVFGVVEHADSTLKSEMRECAEKLRYETIWSIDEYKESTDPLYDGEN